MKEITISLPESTFRELQQTASQSGRTLSQHILSRLVEETEASATEASRNSPSFGEGTQRQLYQRSETEPLDDGTPEGLFSILDRLALPENKTYDELRWEALKEKYDL